MYLYLHIYIYIHTSVYMYMCNTSRRKTMLALQERTTARFGVRVRHGLLLGGSWFFASVSECWVVFTTSHFKVTRSDSWVQVYDTPTPSVFSLQEDVHQKGFPVTPEASNEATSALYHIIRALLLQPRIYILTRSCKALHHPAQKSSMQ